MPPAARLSDADKKALQDEVKREQARAKETPEQQWIRGTIREEIKDLLTEFFTEGDDEGAGEKKAGGPGEFLKGLLGNTGS